MKMNIYNCWINLTFRTWASASLFGGNMWSILTSGKSSLSISRNSMSLKSLFFNPFLVTECTVWLSKFGSRSSIRRTNSCSPHLSTACSISSSLACKKWLCKTFAKCAWSNWWRIEEEATGWNSSLKKCSACLCTHADPWGWLPHL